MVEKSRRSSLANGNKTRSGYPCSYYLRYASWIDEPNDDTIKLDTSAMHCNNPLSNEKVN